MKIHAPPSAPPEAPTQGVQPEIAILVVEDNVDDIMILQRHFSRLAGRFRVAIAYTAAEAIAKAAVEHFDIAFVDHHLPDGRGEVLIGEIRAAHPALPVIMLTGRGDERLAVEVMKAGAYDYLRKDDLSRSILTRTMRNVLSRARLRAELAEREAELAQLAIRDGLTGLFNRRHFAQLISTEFARARRYGQPLACVMLDIDHFKRFNDTRGHQCGDAVLRHIAGLLTGVARQVDVVARYGGEEFILLLPNTDLDGALRVAERIRQTIAHRALVFEGFPLAVTVSLGVSTNDDPGVESTEALVKRADDGLYVAKRTGRNRVCRAEHTDGPAAPDAIVHRRTSTAVLADLVDAHDARLVGQPGRSRAVADAVAHFATRLGCDMDTYEALVIAARLDGLGRLVSTVDAPGAEISAMSHDMLSEIGLSATTLDAIRHRRERWDGTGSPDRLAGEAIPEAARILSVVTRWCRLSSERGPVAACRAIRDDAGSRLDPALVEVFCDLEMEQTDRS